MCTKKPWYNYITNIYFISRFPPFLHFKCGYDVWLFGMHAVSITRTVITIFGVWHAMLCIIQTTLIFMRSEMPKYT